MINIEHKSISDINIKIDQNYTVAFVDIAFNNGDKEHKEYKVVSLAEIQSMIKFGKDICINDKYIRGFSYAGLCPEKNGVLHNFSAENAFFDGRTDFSEAIFDGSVSFSNAMFWDGSVNFEMAKFKESPVNFDGVVFGKDGVSFKNVDFGNGSVSFQHAKFGGMKTSFSGASFGKGNVFFDKADFYEGNVSFFYTEFGEGDVLFNDANFNNADVSFKNTTFGEGNVSFKSAKIQGAKLYFDNASFASSIDRKIIFSELETVDDSSGIISFVDCVILISIVLYIKRITEISFENCTNSGVIDLRTIGNENVSHLRFINLHNLGAVYMNWYSINESLEVPNGNDSESLLADEMKMLKENFHNQGYYDWEDEAYVKYVNHHCNAMSSPKGFILKLFGIIGGYGTKPLRVFLWMFVVVVAFGALYFIMGPQAITNNIETYHLWSPFYYSAITFLTVGYGDLAAQTVWAAILAGIEGFLGVFLMSYFSVSLVRKTLR